MLKHRLLIALFMGILIINPGTFASAADTPSPVWDETGSFEVAVSNVEVFDSINAKTSKFSLYKGMNFKSLGFVENEGKQWIKTKFGNKNYFIVAIEADGKTNVMQARGITEGVVDYYGILNQPHRFAMKLVKGEGAKGRLETYEKTDDGYVFRNSYDVRYPKAGIKDKYGDLKTVGGPVVRYVYRTTNSSRNGVSAGKSFGVYKVSYPMPHDALPYLQAGTMGSAEYNKIPAINEKNGIFTPHPHSRMGADIVIHTDRWGTLGCIIPKNAEMADLYSKDLVTVNDKEIIPFIIYDEGSNAPAEGQLFNILPTSTAFSSNPIMFAKKIA